MTCTIQTAEFLKWTVALTPIVISATVAFVAWRQLRTNKEKLRLDLYNRRFDIYTKTVTFCQALLDYDASKNSGILSPLHREFLKARGEAKFMFKPDSGVVEILNSLNSATFKIKAVKEHVQEPGDTKMQRDAHEAYSSIGKSIDELEKAIARYLNFHKVLA